MLKHISLRKKFILGLFLGCLIPFLTGGLYILQDQTARSYQSNLENARMHLNRTAGHLEQAVLKNMVDLAGTIAADDRLAEPSAFTSYTDFDPDAFQPASSEQERSLSLFFKAIADNHDILTFISYGTESGTYVEYPAFKPTKPYDPRVRPWYMNAIDQEDALINEPYVTSETQEVVISIDKSVRSAAGPVGVISLTVSLDKLMDSISSFSYGKSGVIYILSPEGRFINSPGKPAWRLARPETLGLDVFIEALSQEDGSYEGKLDGRNCIFTVYKSPYSGWQYVSVIDKNEVLAQSKALSGTLVSIYLMTFAIVFLLIYLIAGRITQPILHLAKAINKMSAAQFERGEDAVLRRYADNRDEIGVITRAIYELMSKVHEALDQIRSYNQEITEKNEQLTASEEELVAHLDEISQQKEQIFFLAEHDPLTDLPNRRSFQEKALRVLNSGTHGALLLMDLDNFKGLNDTLGHLFGDRVLQHIAGTLKSLETPDIFVSRFGGDEFLLLYDCRQSDKAELMAFIDTVFRRFNQPFFLDEVEVRLEFSLGISLFPQDSTDINQLIMNADLALYHVKNRGKHAYAFFEHPMAQHLRFKLETRNLLIEALEHDGFKLLYQPQVDLATGEICAYEALLRLKSHDLSPADFIPIAEESGLIIPIGRFVAAAAIAQLARWIGAGLPARPVSINFSSSQMHDLHFCEFLAATLAQHQVPPALVTLEITESVFLENTETTLAFLNQLREIGIKIAVDDFGTGYSSLSYLTFLPIDVLKFDRQLCTKFLEQELAVMDSLIHLAHSLKLKVVAEGIETRTQVKRLRVGKCDYIQGYIFSKPLEVKDVESAYYKVFSM